MSARQISAAAGAPVSSIYHHFGSLERLSLVSQARCLEAAQHWCERWMDEIAGLAGTPQNFAQFFALVVDEWAQGCRPLAFAWRECLLLASRQSVFAEPAAQWRELWAQFWKQAGAAFALGPAQVIVQRVFDSESLLHMIRWRRAVDRAGLQETADGLAAWLSGEPAPPAPWREFAHAEAMRSMPGEPDHDPVTARIRTAAAELIGMAGGGGLTHRAVADRAGVTLGMVSHKFRTKSALLEAAFEESYGTLIRSLSLSVPSSSPLQPARVVADILEAVARSPHPVGADELFVAAARDPSLSAFGAQLRYLRGRSSRATLQGILGERRTASIVEGALFSGFLSSILRTYVGKPEGAEDSRIESEVAALLRLL
jgi:AcrR family transcriptional regulator